MKGIILDYGATLDSGGKHWSEVIWEGYCQMSLPVTKEQFREAYIFAERYLQMTQVVKPDYTFFSLMQARVGIQMTLMVQQGWLTEGDLRTSYKMSSEGEMPTIDSVEELQQHFVDVIAGYCYDYARRCTAEAAPVVEYLSEKYECALVSNFYGNLLAVLQDFGLSRCFSVVIDSTEVGVRKPNPEIYRLAIKKLGMTPDEITVIDIEPALALGCHAIRVGGTSWDASDAKPEFQPTITSLLQLYDML